ncbi:MAG: hypothetical protein HY461_01165 [Parcubacteria group bacterium]|nr:hypothetical protein [Parcubacteria group bacterium]
MFILEELTGIHVMFADVIPLLRLPKRQRVFTYRIPDDWDASRLVGSLVRMPWRQQIVDGVVVSISRTTPIKRTQTLLALHDPQPSWSKAQVRAFLACADRLYCSYADLALQFLPQIPKRMSGKTKTDEAAPALTTSAGTHDAATLKKTALTQLKNILQTEKREAQLLRVNHAGERLAFYRLLAKRHSGQILILAATKQDVEEIVSALSTNHGDEVIDPETSGGKQAQWRDWQAIRDVKKRIIVATRSGVMLPCRNLSCIAIDQEERPEHAQWEAQPRYDSRTIAATLAREAKIPLWLVSYCPRVATAGTYSLQSLATDIPLMRTVVHANGSTLAGLTETTVLAQIQAGKSVLFITPHKARSRAMRCLDCQQSFNCGRCKHPLLEAKNVLHCPTCRTNHPIPTACPRCHGLAIRSYGPGVEGLAALLATYQRAPVVTMESGSDATADLSKPCLIISTPYACKQLASQPHAAIGLVVLFHPESVLFSPTYAANEGYYRFIHWHRLFAHDYEHAPLLVQSGLPLDHPLHTTIVQNNYAAFLASETKMRRGLHLPPFGTLIEISLTAKETEQSSTDKNLSQRLKVLNTATTAVLGPRLAPLPRGQIELHWLIRTSNKTLPPLDKILDSIYNSCIITINPEKPNI